MTRMVRNCLAIAALALLTGCFAPAGPNDPVALGHARWCQENPPSGYCTVPEAN